MKGYKVVRCEDDKLWSVCAHLAQVEYPVGQVVRPRVGKLFAFNNYKRAVKFATVEYDDEFSVLEVWEAEVEGADFPNVIIDPSLTGLGVEVLVHFWVSAAEYEGQLKTLTDLGVEVLAHFWDNGPAGQYWYKRPPTGTILCDQIKLTQKLADYHDFF